ncbi:response regulator [Trichlorobacter lovleyi]|uniref:response regulator n=1 Tax=Trichlorobacter lovleyi TaxID=313985 RepID=UPI00223FE46F|nr:response regulator [Trichlorobacter lovleyi]QOX80165.1 response regulator [Trichlorobacter lovleyi]
MPQTAMIVDDALFIRTVLRTMLEDCGCQILAEAASGLEALRCLHAVTPDLIFLDIILPDANGIDILDDIRHRLPDTAVIICSSISQEQTIHKALQHGAAAYLHKPFTQEAVAAVLRQLEAA